MRQIIQLERSAEIDRFEGFQGHLIPLSEFVASLRAAAAAGDEITWSLLLTKYQFCEHGAQLITGCHDAIDKTVQFSRRRADAVSGK